MPPRTKATQLSAPLGAAGGVQAVPRRSPPGHGCAAAFGQLVAGADRVSWPHGRAGLFPAAGLAPGQPVTVSLGVRGAQITVGVVNPLPPAGGQGPLAGVGAGYGLTGLRERAALAERARSRRGRPTGPGG